MQREERLPPVPADQWNDRQRIASEQFEQLRGRPLFGPFLPLMRSPDLMLAANQMGLYLRYHSALPLRLSEFAIIIIARHWTQQVEWEIHQPIAIEQGIEPAAAADIAAGRRPDKMKPDEAVTYDFVHELLHNRSVTDATYGRALGFFGDQGVVDLAGICGYYSLLAMVMNVARTPSSASGPSLEPFPN